MASGIVIDNLAQFRADLKAAVTGSPRELTAALKRAGTPVLARTKQVSARRTGRLQSGYKVSVRGSQASIVNATPYAAGAEWGERGKWEGFYRYGMRGERFAARAIDELDTVIAETVYQELDDLVSVRGWARP